MALANGVASEEFNANSMDDLDEEESALLAEKIVHAKEVSQWAISSALDSAKFALALQTRGHAKSMAGVKNHNIFKLVCLLIKEPGAKRMGCDDYQLTLGPAFLKHAPRPHLHSALCYWHMASCDSFALHCIASIFVVNSLVKNLRLPRPPIPSPLAVPAPREHGRDTAI
jgi:hypothetical protein